jgi:hypothetical protein
MPSKNRIEAGRRNGALGKGKKSEESRMKCAMNSVRHGLTATALVLSNESKEGFESLRKAYYDRFQPADEVESDVVDDMVGARWRLRRAWSLETETIDIRQDRMQQIPPGEREYIGEPAEVVRIMLAFEKEANDSNTLHLCARYETRLYRNFGRASAELRRLQEERRKQEESEACEEQSILPNEGNAKAVEEQPGRKEPRLARIGPQKIVKMPAPAPISNPKEPITPVTPHNE